MFNKDKLEKFCKAHPKDSKFYELKDLFNELKYYCNKLSNSELLELKLCCKSLLKDGKSNEYILIYLLQKAKYLLKIKE